MDAKSDDGEENEFVPSTEPSLSKEEDCDGPVSETEEVLGLVAESEESSEDTDTDGEYVPSSEPDSITSHCKLC
ncbi:unnamed protein product [Arabis nemorensis]|uniref:Uncharacterized protein n=1 Tax=Arabis nemorensis TaxID=586526 RepID=A0A565AXP2_9BRAS|nr:unnamed protein product [Arabis nemorensis]